MTDPKPFILPGAPLQVIANPHSTSRFVADMRRLELAQRRGDVNRKQLYENDPMNPKAKATR